MEIPAHALKAIQGIMIQTRSMAYNGADLKDIADIMDDGEYLPTILLYGPEYPNEFGDHLRHIAKKFIMCTHVADAYDLAEAAAQEQKCEAARGEELNRDSGKSEAVSAAS